MAFFHVQKNPLRRLELASNSFSWMAVQGVGVDDELEITATEISRRSILRKLALTAGAAAMLGGTASGIRSAAAQTKVSQKLVHYQDTPKGTQRCDDCMYFVAPSSCKLVEGTIEPAGWCQLYAKKPA